MKIKRKDQSKYRKRLISQLSSPFPERRKMAMHRFIELADPQGKEALWQKTLKKIEEGQR